MSPRTLGLALATAVLAALVALVPGAAHAGPADAPTAPTRYLSTPFETAVSGNLCAGATDPQGNPISVSSVNPGTGTVDLAGCAFTYTPPAGASGHNWGFSYRLTDGTNVSLDLVVRVAVGVAGNDPVTASPDALVGKKNRWIVVEDMPAFLLANDADPEGAPLSVGSYSIGTFLPGEMMQSIPGFGAKAMAYRPPTDFVGTRTWVYEAKDGVNETQQAFTITIADAGAFQKPVGVADSYVVPRNGSLVVDRAHSVVANDTDPDSAYIRANGSMVPAHGTITDLNRYTGTFTYTPDPGFVGTDTMTYYPEDPEGTTGGLTTVTFHVVTPPPVAVADSYKTAQGTALVVNAAHGLMANDSDPDSSFTIANVIAGSHGAVNVNHATGAFTYTPAAGWVGTDNFGYRLIDADDNYSSWVNVAVKTVAPGVNEKPDAHADEYVVHQRGTLAVPVGQGLLANDTDFEPGDLDVAAHTEPGHGELTALDPETGAFTYVPDPAWTGTDTFTYTTRDSQGAVSTPATVTIDVVNDPPSAVADSYTTVPGVPFVVTAAEGLLRNDTDPEQDHLKVGTTFPAQHGEVAIDYDDGSFVYTPDAGFIGTDTFTYQARDADWNQSAPATVTIVVQPGTITSPTPSVTGTARVGRVLIAGTATWGPGTVTKSYRWLRDGAPITGATGASYTLAAADLGRKVSVRVTGTKAGYPTVARTSAGVVVARGLLTTARPRIAGTPVAGRLLKAHAGTWGPGTVTKTFRWYRNGVAIKGAIRASYRLTKADRGRRITVRVTGRKTAYLTVVRTSTALRVR